MGHIFHFDSLTLTYICFALFGDLWLLLYMFHCGGVGSVIISVFLKSSIKTS